MRTVLALALTLAMTACASSQAPTYIVTERAVLPLDQAIGLPRAEFERRLGLKPFATRRTTNAEFKNGAVEETVPNAYHDTEGTCPNGHYPATVWRYGEQAGPYNFFEQKLSPAAVFRDGVYVGPAEAPSAFYGDTSLPAYIVTTCTEIRNVTTPGSWLLLPLAVGYVATKAAFDATQPDPSADWIKLDINAPLATLSLGSPPPGGLDAWLANLPPFALLLTEEADRVVVGLYDSTPRDAGTGTEGAIWWDLNKKTYATVEVTVEHGIVTRLKPHMSKICELTPSQTFTCSR